MGSHNEFELFKGKNLSNLFEDIYINQVNKKVKISKFIDEISDKIRHAGDVAVIGPIIKDLIDTSVKNDDQLVKLATIAQRLIISQNKSEDDDGFLSEAEKKQLLEGLHEVKLEVNSELDNIEKEMDNIKNIKS